MYQDIRAVDVKGLVLLHKRNFLITDKCDCCNGNNGFSIKDEIPYYIESHTSWRGGERSSWQSVANHLNALTHEDKFKKAVEWGVSDLLMDVN
jgi:phage FluMu protein Com